MCSWSGGGDDPPLRRQELEPDELGTIHHLVRVWGPGERTCSRRGRTGRSSASTGRTEPDDLGATDTLLDIWGSGGSDVYAVGNGGGAPLRRTSWSGMSSGYRIINAVWGSGASDVFAVGITGRLCTTTEELSR